MPDDLIGRIEDTNLADALSERYLAYALSTIMSRSLPDVRDGLKPVHRRLIYAMQFLIVLERAVLRGTDQQVHVVRPARELVVDVAVAILHHACPGGGRG